MLKEQIRQIVQANPDYAAVTPVIEKEILHHDIMDVLVKQGALQTWVNKPTEDKQGDTSSWKISIVKEANRPDLPRQKMHIDVCAIPSFDVEKRPLLNHYNIVVPTEGMLIPVQSLKEAQVDKLIALAYRARRIKPRDIWDIVWIKQRPQQIKERTIDNPEYWAYVQAEVSAVASILISDAAPKNGFDMGA